MAEIVKLGKLDRKLLLALDFHARDSLTKLAKEIGSSKQTVDYKLRRLERLGVINGYVALVNTPALGYFYCRLLVTLQGTTALVVKEITTYCKSDSRVFWLFEMQGSFDLLIDMWAKSVDEFRVFVEQFMSKFGKFVKRRSENIATTVIHFQNRYITGQVATEEFKLSQSLTPAIFDDLDKKLLHLLSDDARMSLVALSEKLGISAVAVAARIRKLEQKKIIGGYRPRIDHNKLGYGYYKIFLNLSVASAENLKAVKAYLAQQPLVLYVVEGIGFPADMDFEMAAQSPLELDSFMRNLKAAFPGIIADYMALLFTATLKVRYSPF
ncbi:Lrp/AsnC family transcriptional regulator [Candidatus Woesearchaeota archaeon]|nr:Lrp/AsnC family transcriptional regulator [Candidatus Woesearchaeota archaeon]